MATKQKSDEALCKAIRDSMDATARAIAEAWCAGLEVDVGARWDYKYRQTDKICVPPQVTVSRRL